MNAATSVTRHVLFAVVVLVVPAVSAHGQDAVATLLDQARQEFNSGRHGEAFATYDRAIDMATKTGGTSSRRLADVLVMKGYAHAMVGDRPQARSLTERAAAIIEKASGPDSREAILARVMVGAMHVTIGEVAEAKPIYSKAIADALARFGEADATTLHVTESAAQAATRWGDAAEAVRLRRLVVAAQEKARGKDAMETLAARSILAHSLNSAGDVAGAEQAFEEMLRSLERRGMKESGEAAAVRSNLGAMLSQRGEYAKALPALESALATYRRTEGRDAPAVNTIRSNIAGVKMELGRTDEALADYREIVSEFERTNGPDDPLTLTAVNNLANVLTRMQKPAEAVPLLERVAAGLRRTAPAGDPRVLSAEANLAAVYKLVGRGTDAVRIGEATVAAREKLLPPGHTDLGDALGNLADAYMFTGSAAKAVDLTDRQQRNDRIRDARILAALTDAEQATFLDDHTLPELEQAINVAMQARDVPQAADRSAAWLGNAKGRGVEAAAARTRLARAAAVPGNAVRLAELATVRQRMAMAVQVSPQASESDAAKVRSVLATLGDRERVLVRELGVTTEQGGAEWVTIDAIRVAVPRRSVLVDLARVSRIDFKAVASGKRLHEPRYVAWIVPPSGRGTVTIVDLGDARRIERAVAAYRTSMQAVAAAAAKTPASVLGDAESRLNAEVGRPLSSLVLDPILAAIESASSGRTEEAVDELVIVPDGPLWLLPWAALPTSDNRYLVERHAVRLHSAARDIVAQSGAGEKKVDVPGRPLVFADPDFDLAPAALAAALASIDPARAAASAAPAQSPLAGRGFVPSLPKALPLPGTRAEVAAIKVPLESFAAATPEIFLGGAAQETVLKRKAYRPKAIVLATHGYFLAQASADRAAVDPLLRCGLLLAGANSATAERPSGLDDGVLTGLEVAGLDLVGTELVVLSACETGIGDLMIGEGVAGLRKAFQVAGARSVVATLWQVPDAESAQIMAGFYANVAKGESPSKALREAQLAFIKARRDDRNYESAHPYLWAAYGVTGK